MLPALHSFADYLWSQSWQLAPVFVLMSLLCLALRRASAHWRYLLWSVVLLKCIVPAVVLVPMPVLDRVVEEAALATHQASPGGPDAQAGGAALQRLVSDSRGQASPGVQPRLDLRTGLVAVWGAGAVVILLVVMAKALRIQRDLQRARTLPDMELECEFLELVNLLKLRTRPRLCLIRGISQPFVWGVFRGCIYLPQGFAGQGTAHQRRLVIAHELAHVLRWDALANFSQVLIQALFWFHPLVWWLNRMIRHEREKCCDEMAIASLRVDSREYGSAIVDRLATHFEPASPSSSLAISGPRKTSRNRINSILRPNRVFYRRPTGLAVVSVLLATVCIVPMRLGTSAQTNPGATEPRALPMAIDLSPYFNATLSESWLPGTGDNSLGNLSAGTMKLGGVPFDVRGVIQLAGGETDRLGGRFAAAVDGIKVGRPFELLHLLHSASGKDNDGVPVASLVLHYADGGQATVPIRYGETVRDWWFWEFERVRDPATAMAWTGNNSSARGEGASLRLYRMTWKNPRPTIRVQSIDYVSMGSKSAPFLLALTVE